MNLEKLVIKVGVAAPSAVAATTTTPFGGGESSPIFYRLTYEDIQENPFEVLGKQAVLLLFSSSGGNATVTPTTPTPENLSLDDYAITYVYTDSDGDDILIDTEAGLVIAMEEAAEESKKLKLLANIKKIGGGAAALTTTTFDEDDTPPADSAKPNAGKQQGMKNKIQPFIHGNHQCSKCHEHPIIGKRFNGFDQRWDDNGEEINLCEKCIDEYEGDKSELNVVELESDAEQQVQWRRENRAKFVAAMKIKKANRQALQRFKKLVRESFKMAQPSADDDEKTLIECKALLQEALDVDASEIIVVDKEDAEEKAARKKKNKEARRAKKNQNNNNNEDEWLHVKEQQQT